MTRINTNVSSLNAQKSLARNNASLQSALTRLSTGLRINSGKDDPAGLIASEVLRADITGTTVGISNSVRANQVISTADSALGQVSSLLNDIRGLVSEAANSGAMSAEQIAANQLQIDSSLEAIDRIAKTTQFQGRKLLDGNLDFITTGVNSSQISDLQIDQANFGTLAQIDVNVDVVAQATKGSLNYAKGAIGNDLVLEVSGKEGSEAFTFAAGSKISDMASAINLVSDALGVTAEVQSEATKGAITVSSVGADNDIVLTAGTAGQSAGNYRVIFNNPTAGATSTTATVTAPTTKEPGTIEVTLQSTQWAAATVTLDDGNLTNRNAIKITADIKGAQMNGVNVVTAVDGGNKATFDGTTLTIHTTAGDKASAVIGYINNSAETKEFFTAANNLDSDGDGVWNGAAETGTFANGVTAGTIEATANDVITAINNAAGNAGKIVATLATGNDGHGTVTAFDSSAYYGDALQNNRLQFMTQNGTNALPQIKFTSVAGQSLSVDTTTDPAVENFSTAIFQGINANSSIVIKARTSGSEYDGVQLRLIDSTATAKNHVVFDAENKTLDVYYDATGAETANDIVSLINSNTTVNRLFRAENYGTSDGSGTIDATQVGAGTVATTAGGSTTDPGTIIVNLATDANGLVTTKASDLISNSALAALGISVSNADGSDGTGLLAATTSNIAFAKSEYATEDAAVSGTTYAVNGADARILIQAVQEGPEYGGVTVVFEDTAEAGKESVAYDAATKKLTVAINQGTTTAKAVADLIDATAGVDELFNATEQGTGLGLVTDSDGVTLSSGLTVTNAGEGAALLGNSDLTDTGLTFKATEYGSASFVSVKMLSGSNFSLTNAAGTVTDRSVGTDINVRMNGIQAVGSGQSATLNTASLDLSFTLSDTVAVGQQLAFAITGGGATFQMGIDVVSNQQARMGISSVNTAKLGGNSGRLYELRSGGTKSLTGDILGAAKVVDEVIGQISDLRGRLGAFQKTTLDTNINTLNDTLEALTQARSSIQDADFAAESSNLTRAQILVQAGYSVLSTANSNPQNVLKLLG